MIWHSSTCISQLKRCTHEFYSTYLLLWSYPQPSTDTWCPKPNGVHLCRAQRGLTWVLRIPNPLLGVWCWRWSFLPPSLRFARGHFYVCWHAVSFALSSSICKSSLHLQVISIYGAFYIHGTLLGSYGYPWNWFTWHPRLHLFAEH